MGRNDSRSPPRRGGGGGGRGRDRSRSRGGGRGGRGGGGPEEWGTSGVIVEKRDSGFGFIRPDSGKVNDQDLYFHAKECKCSFDELRTDDAVTYVADYDDRKGKFMATQVQLKGGGGGGGGGRKRDDSRGRDDSRRRGRR
eukprot:TRINITY_DN1195_c1_g1_i4.p2 TRINITY_DN1195_c1_g1~~TRINITY_DN1195_c1_g1_i4.p2  ORF type:complete len:140 (-),score=25.05 TRINITY_DN1195_c1_g1_i4:16-435(-)